MKINERKIARTDTIFIYQNESMHAFCKPNKFVRAFENMRSAKNFNFAPSHRYQIGPHGSILKKKTLRRKHELKQ